MDNNPLFSSLKELAWKIPIMVMLFVGNTNEPSMLADSISDVRIDYYTDKIIENGSYKSFLKMSMDGIKETYVNVYIWTLLAGYSMHKMTVILIAVILLIRPVYIISTFFIVCIDRIREVRFNKKMRTCCPIGEYHKT